MEHNSMERNSMEQKIKALKASSKVISVITKIGYTAMIVMLCICVFMLIFLAVTGGQTSRFTLGGTNIIIFDEAASTPAQLAAICVVLIVMGGILLSIFLLAYRMFCEISRTGEPFEERYAKTVRVIGILTAAMPIAVGMATTFAGAEIPELYTDAPGIVVGAIIFCLSYIIDYGCGLSRKPDAASHREIGA